MASLRSRVARFVEANDPGPLVGPEALEEVAQVAATSPDAVQARVLLMAGVVFWHRHLALNGQDNQYELAAALTLLRPFYDAAPDTLPTPVRLQFEELAGSAPSVSVNEADRAAQLVMKALGVVLAASTQWHADYVPYLSTVGVGLQGRFHQTGAMDDLAEAIVALQRAVDATPDNHPILGRNRYNLSISLRIWSERTGQSSVVDEAIALARQAVEAAPNDHLNPASALSNLGLVLHSRFEQTQDLAALAEAITMGRRALNATPDDYPTRYVFMTNLSTAMLGWFQQTGDLATLRDAVMIGRQAVGATPDNGPVKAACLSNLNAALLRLFEQTQDLAALAEAITAGHQAVAATPDSDPRQGRFLCNLGISLHRRFKQTGATNDLAEAIAIGRRAVDATADDHLMHPKALSNLGVALTSAFEQATDLACLREAIAVLRRAVDTTPADHASQGWSLSNLGGALRTWFEWTGDTAALHEAITVLRRAADVTPEGHANQGPCYSELGGALRNQFEQTGDAAALTEAIMAYRRAVAAQPDGHSQRAASLSSLGIGLQRRFEQTGDIAALTEAGTVLRRAVAASPDGDPNRSTHLYYLAGVLWRQFEQTGDMTGLTEAITVARESVDTTPDGHSSLAGALHNLGVGLLRRFEHTGDLASLAEAIAVHRRAVDASPDGHLGQAVILSNLGLALERWFERTGQLDTLEEAVTIYRRTVGATPDGHSHQGLRLAGLGNSLLLWCERTGDIASLAEAVTVARRAVEVTPDGDPHKGLCLNSLGSILSSWFERTAEQTALVESITVLREAVGMTPDGHPNRGLFLNNLSLALADSFQRTNDPNTLTEATDTMRAAATLTTTALGIRIQTAYSWGTMAMIAGRPADAADGFATAVRLLPQVAARHLRRGDAQHWLARFAGIASNAAACALEVGDHDRAVALLEQGRGVLVAQTLESRSDLTQLREQDPNLADQFERLCRQLDTPDDNAIVRTTIDAFPGLDPAISSSRVTEQRQALAAELDALIAQIRQLPGLRRFLLAPLTSELTAQTHDGPIAMINVSQYRCDALLLTPDGVRVVPLTNLTREGVLERVDTFQTALNTTGAPDRSASDRWRAGQIIKDTLAWLWDTITEPILDALGRNDMPATDAPWPRLWWMPTGPLSLLPLHAAGHHTDRTRRTVLDRVISSYTPTVRALAHARTQPTAPDATTPMLVVAMPRTPGATDLPGAQAEAHLLTAHFPTARVLTEQQATRDTVLAALHTAPWAHFACHGHNDPSDPSSSHLLLQDHRHNLLSVLDISRQRSHCGELAYLSACNTTATSPTLADEAIHITGAFQLAGYTHVIGTLWAIDDTVAVLIAKQVYGVLTANTPDAHRAALAVHHATRRIRDTYPHTPSLWAAHIHTGP